MLTRRFVLTGLITAPMIVRPTSLMPIFDIGDWDPYVLGYELRWGTHNHRGWLESSNNFEWNGNVLGERKSFDMIAKSFTARSLERKNYIHDSHYKIVRRSAITLARRVEDYPHLAGVPFKVV